MNKQGLLVTTLASIFLLSACGGGGGGGSTSASVTPTPTPTGDTTSPSVSFSPASLTVASAGTGTSTLTASDNVGVTSGPTVTCTNGGTFSGSTFTAPTVTANTTSVCTATASDAANNTGSAALTVTVTPPPTTVAPTNVTISGKITFDFVPHNTVTSGLNYASISQLPARGITVEAVNNSGAILSSTVTNATGDYALSVNANTTVRIRAKSEMIQTSGAQWDVKATDNTQSNSVYAIQGTLTSSGTANSVRNLNAASGWGGSSYTATRAAAPFAILNPVYDALQAVAAVDADVVFPATEFRWSTNNVAVSGDLTTGQIGTSSYVRAAGETVGNMYILGDENSDTDEYDRHVIVHEWGHYFEDQLSRSDSIGGPHSSADRLDPRVAMGEGWGNALSGMIIGDSVYRDSSGSMQAQGFGIDVENNNYGNAGWYNEGSVQSILYDIFDSTDDGSDNLSLGFGPIYDTFTSPDYIGLEYFTTIFGYINQLKTLQPGNAAAIDAIVNAQSINGTGPSGSGETNNGTVASALPIFNTLTPNGAAVNICSVDDNGSYNKLGNREYLRLTVPATTNYTFTMTKTSGPASTDPDFLVLQGNLIYLSGESSVNNTETGSVTLAAGVYLIDAYDFNNTGAGQTQADSCFNFTVTG